MKREISGWWTWSRNAIALKPIGLSTFWVAIGAAAGQGATLCVNVLIANVLTPGSFGAYAFLQGTQNSLALVAQLSLGLAATKYIPSWRVQSPARAGQFLGIGTVFSAGLGCLAAVGFAGFTATFGLDLGMPTSETWVAVGLTAVAVPFLALIHFQNGVLIGFEAFRSYALMSVVTASLAVVLPAFGAAVYGVRGAILGLGMVALIRVVGGRIVIAKNAKIHGISAIFARSREMLKLVIDFALPGSLSSVVAMLALWSVSLLILNQEGAEKFGLYAVAFTIRQLVLFVPVQLASVSLTLMSSRVANAGASDHVDILKSSLLMTVAMAGVIALVVGLAARPVLGIFGPSFAAGESLLRIMLVSALLEATATSTSQVLPLRGLMWKSLKWVGLPRDLSLLFVAWLAVPYFGIIGGAIAQIVSQLIALIGIYVASRSKQKL